MWVTTISEQIGHLTIEFEGIPVSPQVEIRAIGSNLVTSKVLLKNLSCVSNLRM